MRYRYSINSKGMTLTEVMVSSIVGAIIAGVVLSIIMLTMSSTGESAANAQMLSQSRALVARLDEAVRESNAVLNEGETWSASIAGLDPAPVATIVLYSDSGTINGAFRLSGGTVQTSPDGSAWSDMTVAGHDVTAESGNPFFLSADRKTVALDITLTANNRGRSYSLPIQGDTFRCRN